MVRFFLLLLTQHVLTLRCFDLTEGWWSGVRVDESGEEIASGLYPSNYVELIIEEAAPLSPVAPAHIPTPPPPPPAPPAPPMAVHEPEPEPEEEEGKEEGGRESAIALYDYEAAEEGELSFVEGDQITALDFVNESWWSGTLNGVTGVFPGEVFFLSSRFLIRV